MCSSRWGSLTAGRTVMGHEGILPVRHGMSQDIWIPSKQYAAQIWGSGLRMLTPCETVSQGSTRTGLCFAEAALLVRRRVTPNVICALTGAEEVCYGPSPGPPQAPGIRLPTIASSAAGRWVMGRAPTSRADRHRRAQDQGQVRNIPTNMTNTAGARVTCEFAIHQPSPSRADR